jgi:tetratricopeptide (TPR) repeat protein
MTGKAGRRVLSAVVAALALTAATPTVHAENPARAKVAYKEGLLQYNLGEYAKALEKFKAAYLELPDPAFLFNIAQCQRQLGEYGPASKSYRAFLREANVPNRTRDEVQRLILDMDEAVRDARAKAPPTGMQPPSTEIGKTEPPPPEPPKPEPPPPVAPKAELAIAAAPPPPPRPWYKNPAGMTLTFGGAALVVVGGGLLGAAASADSSSRSAMSLPDQRSFHDNAVTLNSAGIAMLSIGAVATVAGTVVLIVRARRHSTVRQ